MTGYGMRSSGPQNGSLLLIGGGTFGAEIQEEHVRLARDPNGRSEWVFIPTAATDEEIPYAWPPAFISRSAETVTTLHTRDRAEADDETFVAPLRTATAVFISGGRQYRLVDAYAGTRIERELREVLDRGGLIAGNSAGATVLGSYLVRGHPSDDNSILMYPGYERGFGYLTNSAIDQHVSTRNREYDLAAVVAAHPNLLGVGIDESTAVVVQRNMMRVIGTGCIFITDGDIHDGKPYYQLRAGAQFNLSNWSVHPRKESSN
jgi:cyanophycinase